MARARVPKPENLMTAADFGRSRGMNERTARRFLEAQVRQAGGAPRWWIRVGRRWKVDPIAFAEDVYPRYRPGEYGRVKHALDLLPKLHRNTEKLMTMLLDQQDEIDVLRTKITALEKQIAAQSRR